MAKNDNLKDFVTDIADAIREKKGTTEKINPQDFSDEIRGIEGGIVDNQWHADVVWNDDATFGFDSMKEIRIHEGVTTLGKRAFRYNSTIDKIILPQSLTTIKEYSLNGMAKINHIDLPENVEYIGNYTFAGSPFISLVFPKKVQYIRYGTCQGCTKLEFVEILCSEKVNIGGNAFQNCSALQYISFVNTTKVGGLDSTSAFTNTTCQIVVPDALYDDWIVATNWVTYADRIIKASEFKQNNNG